MTRRILPVFENTLQKTYAWLHDIMDEMAWDDPHKAYLALRATLHALRDRLPFEVAVKLGAQLPMLIRGFYYEGWKPSRTPFKITHVSDFFELVAAYLHSSLFGVLDSVEEIVATVIRVMEKFLSPGEMEHIVKVLPLSFAPLFT